ncbi:hypothetical protein TSAR_008952 [Trichomalopsis sarcophagae]|uniref:Mutator-like transposase domain-containing protein n=1 Tax=Trichomalopsis sarcophagae TaxID=543379 RepID=A0A232EI01_9HYME|nr:hypothetical protein TSAR_008952 [Trichomalopsis sarcophagae]
MQTLAEQLICKKCDSILSLMDSYEEKRVGLASIFYVKCRTCAVISSVCTDKQHDAAGKNIHFDTNTKALVGTLNGGMGNTHLNNFLCSFNIPEFNWKTFKTHEKEVGSIMEKMAQESCKSAAKGKNKLENLARTLGISSNDAHNAIADVRMLKEIGIN